MSTVREDVQDQIIAIRETIMDGWKDLKSFMQETWPALTILLVILVGALWFADPAPPRHVLMATGPQGSSFEALGKSYQAYFAQHGVELALVPTEGSKENIERLQNPADPVMAAFVMSGTAARHAPGIETLGSINYQPFWCFYRSAQPLSIEERERFFTTRPFNIGQPGSGTFLFASRFVHMIGLATERANFRHLPDNEAIEALRAGQLDGLCTVDMFESPNVQKLLRLDGVQISDFERAQAIARMESSIEMLTIPEGALNLAVNRPAQSMQLIAATTELVIDQRLHPAIQTLFLMAARAIDGKQSFFSQEGEFPVFKDSGLRRSKEAEIFYEKGTPVLMEFMPFWLAEFIRRVLITMLPFFAVAYPVIRSMPNYHKNRVRGRINRMYGALKFFEQSLLTGYDPGQKVQYLAQLDSMEREALSMKVPKSVASDYYTLRSSLDFVRNCVLRDSYNVHAQAQTFSHTDTAPDDGDGDDV